MSDSSLHMFPRNTRCCFRTKLPKQIDINKQDWEVAVVELILPTQLVNVTEEERFFNVVSTDKKVIQELTRFGKGRPYLPHGARLSIPAGVYTSAGHMLEEMNATIQAVCGDIFTKHNIVFQIAYSPTQKRVKIAKNSDKRIGLELHPNLRMKLGGTPTGFEDVFTYDKDPFPYSPDLNMGYNFLFIYSDIADYTMIGNVEAPLLRVVSFTATNNEQAGHHHEEFLNLHYVPVAKASFDEIGIHIKGETGDSVHFANGKSMVKLHFRRRKLQFPL